MYVHSEERIKICTLFLYFCVTIINSAHMTHALLWPIFWSILFLHTMRRRQRLGVQENVCAPDYYYFTLIWLCLRARKMRSSRRNIKRTNQRNLMSLCATTPTTTTTTVCRSTALLMELLVIYSFIFFFLSGKMINMLRFT